MWEGWWFYEDGFGWLSSEVILFLRFLKLVFFVVGFVGGVVGLD